ncbi:D-alanine--D-alanine ligase [Leptospira gomenensis]|uniref:D-alanine--D-alanine ligase n=1 Tax=Leptospira gomenensis TaxID=2484974 RepID=A0A5F1YG34_9LEPT|nr:D-alanine--D-alanine ligase [Leptospira gomenensis]TGK39363.1 D-alanine--D-alanine ligase [Leptospira gomenensis]TGK44077.1 D-alanine--D-alanine ligase [Leptospira gomenensis]TGK44304.1 D-alanine--D-alanine ligase [Leptospira gomenensis]TGK65851.1 D-alanine--D-alanine ligase [Leptospira gomenensis]
MNQRESPSVIVYADLHEFEGDFPESYKQEWESGRSADSILKTLDDIGERAVLSETPEDLLEKLNLYSGLPEVSKPVLFHLMEGFRSRNREALLPAVAEMFGFPHTGSDAYAQNVSLDKNLTRMIAASVGIPVADASLIRNRSDFPFPEDREFPRFLKPNGEGSSLGIGEGSIVRSRLEFDLRIDSLPEEYFPLLSERYLSGTEYTISVMGSSRGGYRVSNAGRVVLREERKIEEVYGEKTKSKSIMPETLVFDCPSSLETFLKERSVVLCEELGSSGPARLDWKCDDAGEPFFLEINLTPGLSPFYSTFPICYRQSLGDEKTLFQEMIRIARSEFTGARFLYSRRKRSSILFPK